ncbi:nucleotidyltransferase domain-containing protein [aff. Roholtiella sp. LEGE 12411]|uniref:nucleotidyltransferase domain-containing protein n=1 Tax=aff. Roholtiella sp. LEGE 12411 TaxID=1828822 RepID=UPI001882C596|nr:nucleotidyltransferase family protein [aff. Roholtiella sp. LEGE 12411]MBE9034024.1 nucleotidyltransferase family protein [aff. Roholtiella sp. LEGE 12411]
MEILSQPDTENQKIKTHREVELLICCARTQLDSSTIERIKALVQQDLNWSYIIPTAVFHKVMPLLYQNLSNTCPELVPKPALAQLLSYFQANVRRNLSLTGELIKLLNLFDSQGISVIPIKGAILAVSAYGNIALRQFSDIDILVRHQEALRARDLLVSQGYESSYNFTRQQEVARLKSPFCKDNNYHHKNTGINIDFHWKLLQTYLSFPLEHECLWERQKSLSLAGKIILNLSPEDNLLFLCVHGSRDRWKKLQLISDVATLICISPDIDWVLVMKQANMLGCKRRLFLGILLAKDLLGIELPEEILQRIQVEPEIKSLTIEVIEKLFRQNDDIPKVFDKSFFDIRIRERLQDKVQYSIYQSILVIARSNRLFPAWI